MTRYLQIFLIGAAFAALTGGCGGGDDTIDIQIFPAIYDTDPQAPPPEGWQRLTFEGNLRSRPATVLVGTVPLLTGWNILAFHAAEETDGSRAISIRLNAYGQSKMKQYCAEEGRLKQPLAMRVDDRWADVSPLLTNVTDRMTMYGLQPEETDRLQRWIEIR
ncbi:MAG: hypothetical protein HN712_13700 [Gemmatimonadetes bacterium]|nr:hypothetical protein [Gemmatimonadota bacterium]MBT7861371.1 hypothetical protein [Gemmatimonadota bacterium]